MSYPRPPPASASCFLSGSAGSAANIYATTTGTLTIGDGPVNIGKAGSATTVDGTMTVSQDVTITTDLIVNGGDITHGKRHK